MSKDEIIELKKRGEGSEDPLTELLLNGARNLLACAVVAELQGQLNPYTESNKEQGYLQIVSNGNLPLKGLCKQELAKLKSKFRRFEIKVS
jgi:hypothetical protein